MLCGRLASFVRSSFPNRVIVIELAETWMIAQAHFCGNFHEISRRCPEPAIIYRLDPHHIWRNFDVIEFADDPKVERNPARRKVK